MQDIMPFISAHPVLSLAWVALLIAVIVTTFKTRFSKVKEITRGEATRLINKEDAIVVDVRAREEFRKGHIAESQNVLSADIKNNNLGELTKHKAQPVIVVCATGQTSRTAAEGLIAAGFERVFTLKEGISGWSGENLPLVRGK
ncbi:MULTISPECIES: rhodanese-like domain-containing protein [Rahnella]|jgi:rhodanese-related sulfurtransferase|uniref:Rhodanese-related sulfurtransferase n=4 Tax=Rahnella TaxID=34037 RepID=H2IXK1_RAHAC|nr:MULTISPECIES: rhodanese-like domain-containing protein [Rahnella]MCL9645189.1 rhodanese-like domain-containing protein [Rahnella victoriana]AEX54191.1 Rhodanese-related sulfurtransferase [Rahnella aquatilis CIP 78.65 = ATCC 33071]KFD00524.1 rhodanese family sulfurtransferase [Rahnella aquatilis CIP 78.65 = ATCC 33071]MBU9845185.1 rhodanese-like domain-containing protein [Rahnella ecdela]MBU9854672.1 rhodanese-like domain-containing protein [Rahnella bonaserana]